MKKFIALLLAILAVLLCACSNVGEQGGTTAATTTATQTPETVIDYESIERYHATGYSPHYFGAMGDKLVLSLELPQEWALAESEGYLDISRDGRSIGKIFLGEPADASAWSPLERDGASTDRCKTSMTIESNEDSVRYRFTFNYTSDTTNMIVTLLADCAEIDASLEEKLLASSAASTQKSETVGFLSYLEDPQRILILGNSFISTSNIGDILTEMMTLNEKSCSVKAISRGNATVATYISDSSIMSEIRNGRYDAVFLCGLYDNGEIQNVATMKRACEVSETTLVIFPAHNENLTTLATAKVKDPSLLFLNWRSEIDRLIRGGVNVWDFCRNDACRHSTPLAGYVGAHMIYRAIYGELPSTPMRSSISQSYVDNLLGDYAYTADFVDAIPPAQIHYVK